MKDKEVFKTEKERLERVINVIKNQISLTIIPVLSHQKHLQQQECHHV